jgi:hypothetical protein
MKFKVDWDLGTADSATRVQVSICWVLTACLELGSFVQQVSCPSS